MVVKSRYQKGDRIGGRYLVHQALIGGMGEVYLCLDEKENYPFALKTFQGKSADLRDIFYEEVGKWVALEKHPNIVRCFHMDTLDNRPFAILEWVANLEGKGSSLRDWLRFGSLDLKTALDFTIDMVRGLIHAQKMSPGIVHRDLKPDNILIDQSRLAKITDFGLATIAQQVQLSVEESLRENTLQQTMHGNGSMAGTPYYMAPEQWDPHFQPFTPQTDMYAVGCILYEMLSGKFAFEADTMAELKQRHLEGELPALNGHHPPEVASIQLCLNKAMPDRPVNLVQLLQQLIELYQTSFTDLPRPIDENQVFTAGDHNNRGRPASVVCPSRCLAKIGQSILPMF